MAQPQGTSVCINYLNTSHLLENDKFRMKTKSLFVTSGLDLRKDGSYCRLYKKHKTNNQLDAEPVSMKVFYKKEASIKFL